MRVYLGSDHGGFKQKEQVAAVLARQGHEITDCGSYSSDATDYPDFAVAVGNSVASHPGSRGMLFCRSGEGMEMAVNKVPKIRGCLAWSQTVAHESRRDNDANVLVLPSDFVSDEHAEHIALEFLSTEFSGEERHIRRLEKLHNIEHTRYES